MLQRVGIYSPTLGPEGFRAVRADPACTVRFLFRVLRKNFFPARLGKVGAPYATTCEIPHHCVGARFLAAGLVVGDFTRCSIGKRSGRRNPAPLLKMHPAGRQIDRLCYNV